MPSRTARLDALVTVLQQEKEAGRLSDTARTAFLSIVRLVAEATADRSSAPPPSPPLDREAKPMPYKALAMAAFTALGL